MSTIDTLSTGRIRPHAVMRNPQPGEFTWTSGFWADRWNALRDHMIPSQRAALDDPTNAAYFGNFAAAANLVEHRAFHGVDWSDGDCYKYLEALILISAREPDASRDAEIEAKIEVIAAAQEPDGYLSTNVQVKQLGRWTDTHNHELYNMGHLLSAASTHYALTGRRNFLDVAIRNADYLDATFGPRPVELAHFGWNPSNIMGLVDLYRVTDEARYLRLAETFVDMRGSQPGGSDQNQDNTPFRKETRAVGHAVTGPYLYAGAVDVATETGDQELLDASSRIWRSATERRMYITGGIGSHHYSATPRQDRVWEAFGLDYDLPNGTGYNETCANWSLAMWSHRHAMLSGDAAYTDIVERVMFNAGLSGVSIDGHSFCYTNPLRWYGADHELLSNDAAARWQRFGCYCCPVQVTRTIARMHEWFYGIGDDALWVHQFGGSRLDTELGDGRRLTVLQETDYPWNGSVRLTVESAPDGDCSIHIRIPEWATDAQVSVNDEAPVDGALSGSYLELRRDWNDGDAVTIELAMPVVPVAAHARVESARNQVALTRGPVVYCLESVDLPDDIDIWNTSVELGRPWTIEHRDDRLGGATVLRGQVDVTNTDDASGRLYQPVGASETQRIDAVLVPYFAWGNRPPTEMAVWLPLSSATSPT